MFSGSLFNSLVALDLGSQGWELLPVSEQLTWEAALCFEGSALATCSDTRVSGQAGAGGPRAAPLALQAASTQASSGRGDSLSVVLTSELRCSALSKACVLRGRTVLTRLLGFCFGSGSHGDSRCVDVCTGMKLCFSIMANNKEFSFRVSWED